MLPNLDFIGKPLIYILVYLTLFAGFYILFIFLVINFLLDIFC